MALIDSMIVGGGAQSTAAQARDYLLAVNAAQARAKGVAPLGPTEAATIVAAYRERGARYGIAADGALAESILETDAYTFGGQVRASQHNPAGLGATNDGASGGGWPDWPSGIDAHFVHLLAWCGDRRGDGDYRIAAVRATAQAKGWASTWRSLGGRWAVRDGVPWQQQATMPNSYGDGIERHWQGIVTTAAASAAQGGKMDKPAVISRPSPNRNGYSSPHDPKAICLHITAGSGASALSWLTSPASQASANYVNMEDGTLCELVPPTESAWANGAVNKPNMANPIVAATLNAGRNMNTATISIENAGQTSGGKGGSLSAAQVKSLIALCAWLCQRFGIPADHDHIIPHAYVDSVNRPYCPGFSALEWSLWIVQIDDLVRGGGQSVQDSIATGIGAQPESIDTSIDARGHAIVTLDFGGNATAIKGFTVVDCGVSVANAAGEIYDRSIKNTVFEPWVKRG